MESQPPPPIPRKEAGSRRNRTPLLFCSITGTLGFIRTSVHSNNGIHRTVRAFSCPRFPNALFPPSLHLLRPARKFLSQNLSDIGPLCPSTNLCFPMKKIGKYDIVEELGRGGMGIVYKAHDPSLERDVALKVIRESALDEADIRARFYREARMAARLTHDAIAVIYEIGEEGGVPFIAMEYLPGRDLKDLIDRKEHLPLEHKLDIARQVCRGLQYAHAKNVVHRDIKPENIKLLDDGRVKVIDFGIAKPYTPTASEEDKSTNAVLTRVGMRIGTPWYMSPEQARGNPVDKRSDIFSFGVVLYELLTLTKPFQGDDTTVLYKILHEDPPPIKLDESGLTEEIQKILFHCLAKDQDDRYADCSEILRDLVALTGNPSNDPRVLTLLSKGIASDKAEQYTEAAAFFNQILEIDPGNQEAKSFLKRLQIRDRESLMRRVLGGDIIGTVISHFQILDRIGGGGMGVVYRAEDMSLKRIVALKFLMPDMLRDPSAKKRFLKEAQAASALDHPNICTVHEIGETPEGLLFICMAYYGGENLKARITHGSLTTDEAIDIVVRIGRGLAKAHESGIVHRDIKPANIIISPDGEVKIVDFGLAKLSGGTQITRVGTRIGTLPFMSPEQIKGLDLDHRTDIWSLAVLLFQALTGQLPFQQEYEAAMLYAIVNDDAPLVTAVRPDLPPDLARVIGKALKKSPADRYASVQTMVDELEKIKVQIVRNKVEAGEHVQESEVLLREAKDLMAHGKYRESLSRLERILKLLPDHVHARTMRDECRRKIEQADQVTILLRQGTALYDKGKFREAKEVLQTVLTVDPAQHEATRFLEKANDSLEKGERIEKLIADAEISLKHDKYDAALSAYHGALTLDPENQDAQRGLKKVEKVRAGTPRRHATPLPGTRPAGRKKLWLALGAAAVLIAGTTVVLLVQKSRPELPSSPVTAAIEPKPDPSGPAIDARNAMLGRKATAESAGAPARAREKFGQALALERRGEGEFDSGSYSSARSTFDESARLYADATEEAAKTPPASARPDVEPKQAATAHEAARKPADDSGRIAGLMRDADNSLAAMNQAKSALPGGENERRASAKFRAAQDAENSARGLYQSQRFPEASGEFARAKSLYGEAAGEISTAIAEAKAKPVAVESRPPEKKDTAKLERDEREASLRRTLESYRKSFEEGDIQTVASLRNLSGDAAKSYNEFFKSTDNRTMSIGQVTLQPDLTHARAELTQRFSNKDHGDDLQTLSLVSALEFVNGRWTITSFSRK
jgi:serine/threonine protein kinase